MFSSGEKRSYGMGFITVILAIALIAGLAVYFLSKSSVLAPQNVGENVLQPIDEAKNAKGLEDQHSADINNELNQN